MKKKNLISNLISLPLLFVLAFVYIYTYHQLQASHGIGLYYALKMDMADNRIYFDIAADLVRFALLAILTLLPSLFTKRIAPIYIIRRASLLIATASTISIGCFINFFNDMHFGINIDFYQGLLSYANLFKVVLPMFCIFIIAAYKSSDKFDVKKYMPVFIIALVSFILSLSVNKFFEPGVYLTFYAFIVMLIHISETKINQESSFTKFDILNAFLYISALYRLIQIAFHTN